MQLAISEVKSSVINLNEVKNDIMEVTYFLNDPMFKLLFYCHIILYREKLTSYEKFSLNLPLKSKLSGKFQCFKAINGSIERLKNRRFSKTFN